MALRLITHFDVRADVLPSLRAQAAAAAEGGGAGVLETAYESLRVLNIERDGNILYTYKHLYTFERDMQAVSCSVNSERTLLGSKCLTLLVEIHPVNHEKVLKAVDSCIWVQILSGFISRSPEKMGTEWFVNFGYDYHQDQEKSWNQPSLCIFTSHTEELDMNGSNHSLQKGHYNCLVTYRVHLARDLECRPFLAMPKGVENGPCSSQSALRLKIPKFDSGEEVTYSVFYLHKGCLVAVYFPGHFLHLLNVQHPDFTCHSLFLTGNSEMAAVLPPGPLRVLPGSLVLDCSSGKLYRAALDQSFLMWFLWNSAHLDCEKMAALHCVLSCAQDPGFQDDQIIQWICERVSACHSFDLIQEFLIASSYWSVYPDLAGVDRLLPYSSVLTWNTEIPGLMLVTEELPLPLMKLGLQVYDNTMTSQKKMFRRNIIHSSVASRVAAATFHFLFVSAVENGAKKVHSVCEEHSRQRNQCKVSQSGESDFWSNSLAVTSQSESLCPSALFALVTGCLISSVTFKATELWGQQIKGSHTVLPLRPAIPRIMSLEEPRLIPLLQEEDRHQRLLVGLMVSELRDHLLRHLQGVERKKIEQRVLDYVSKQNLEIIRLTNRSIQRQRERSFHDFAKFGNNHGSAAHFEVFHLMTRILDATSSLCVPLPPGFHSLHTLLGVHCLPLYNLLHYIDNGVLLLTETAVTRLMKDLDNSEKNEQLKFSIIVRLPLCTGQKVFRLWDHPMSSNIISRNHVAQMLRSYKKEPRNSMIGKSSFSTEFLPLNYFIDILAGLESSHQASRDFEGHDSVDADFVEEAALKHTSVLLGL
ncbi:hypothetical protein ACRRTK_024706 [Alexandromys fortis]